MSERKPNVFWRELDWKARFSAKDVARLQKEAKAAGVRSPELFEPSVEAVDARVLVVGPPNTPDDIGDMLVDMMLPFERFSLHVDGDGGLWLRCEKFRKRDVSAGAWPTLAKAIRDMDGIWVSRRWYEKVHALYCEALGR